jgi:uncharacterized protein
MTTPVDESRKVSVRLSADAMTCQVSIESGVVDAASLQEQCKTALSDLGIHLTDDLHDLIEESITSFLTRPHQPYAFELVGKPAIDGEDGSFEWADDLDPAKRKHQQAPEGGAIDHYSRSKFVCIEAGRVIGTALQATDGEDGIDLLGRVLKANPGKPVPVQFDETISQDPNGDLIARVSGSLEKRGSMLHVFQDLEIKGCVDFSTGNIDFNGTVIVADGIKDNFKVVVRDDLTLGGVIDAADVTVGRDLTVKGGISGKERALVNVGRNATARYISQATIRIGRELTVEREMLNCDAHVGGSLNVVGGGIVGGRLHAVGAVNAQFVGSAAGVPTVLYLGSSPQGAKQLNRVASQREAVQKTLLSKQNCVAKIKSRSSRPSTEDALALHEAQTIIPELEEKLKVLEDLYARLLQAFQSLRVIELRVEKLIHPGVRLFVGQTEVVFKSGIKGPVRIYAGEQGQLLISEREGAPCLLSTVATVVEGVKMTA